MTTLIINGLKFSLDIDLLTNREAIRDEIAASVENDIEDIPAAELAAMHAAAIAEDQAATDRLNCIAHRALKQHTADWDCWTKTEGTAIPMAMIEAVK